MTDHEIQLLQHELALRGVDMVVPKYVYHMDLDEALSACLDLYTGYSFRQAIGAYDERYI